MHESGKWRGEGRKQKKEIFGKNMTSICFPFFLFSFTASKTYFFTVSTRPYHWNKKTLRVCFPSHLSSKLIKVGTEAKKLSLAYLFPLIWPYSSYLSIDKESLLLWMRSFGIKKRLLPLWQLCLDPPTFLSILSFLSAFVFPYGGRKNEAG